LRESVCTFDSCLYRCKAFRVCVARQLQGDKYVINKLLVVDTETGGLDPSKQSILSLAGVVMQDNAVLDTIEIFVNEPDIHADAAALKVNGIKLDWLRENGKTPLQAAEELGTFLYKHFGTAAQFSNRIVLVGQNTKFDIGFLKRLYRLAYGVDGARIFEQRFSHRDLDTAVLLRFFGMAHVLPFDGGSLDDAATHYKIKTDDLPRHSALGDALLCARVLVTLVNHAKVMHDLSRAYLAREF
jgi:DNA polymerase III epsilon subunit-like protein